MCVFHQGAVSQVLDSLEDVQCLTNTTTDHFLQDVFEDSQLHALLNVSALSFLLPWSLYYFRVRTGPGKPGKSWNLIIWIPGLESHGILDQVLESHGISCWQMCLQQSCLLFWIV